MRRLLVSPGDFWCLLQGDASPGDVSSQSMSSGFSCTLSFHITVELFTVNLYLDLHYFALSLGCFQLVLVTVESVTVNLYLDLHYFALSQFWFQLVLVTVESVTVNLYLDFHISVFQVVVTVESVTVNLYLDLHHFAIRPFSHLVSSCYSGICYCELVLGLTSLVLLVSSCYSGICYFELVLEFGLQSVLVTVEPVTMNLYFD